MDSCVACTLRCMIRSLLRMVRRTTKHPPITVRWNWHQLHNSPTKNDKKCLHCRKEISISDWASITAFIYRFCQARRSPAAAYGGAPRFSCHLREKFPGLPLLLNFASFASSSIAARSFCMISQDWSGRTGDL